MVGRRQANSILRRGKYSRRYTARRLQQAVSYPTMLDMTFPEFEAPANKQIASTIPAITSRDVMIASRRAALFDLPLLQPVATGGERKRGDHVAVCVKQRRGSLDRKLIQGSVERHRTQVVPCAQEVAIGVP